MVSLKLLLMTDEVLGVHMIRCADLIAEAVVSMEFKASAEDISRMSHASYFCRSGQRSCLSSYR
jgi:dihydrolipoamide dehydrogenase